VYVKQDLVIINLRGVSTQSNKTTRC